MTQINKELYDALKAANVPEDKAIAAAQSVEESKPKSLIVTLFNKVIHWGSLIIVIGLSAIGLISLLPW